MSISKLENEAIEINKLMNEAVERKEALTADLGPLIHKYFSSRVLSEKNPDKRRDYAYFNSTKKFEILEGGTLRFTARNRSGLITYDVLITDLIEG